jgi:hypothetical protein
VKWRRIHKESQPLEQLDREIEEIRRLMLRLAHETANKERMRKMKPAIAVGKQQQQR